MQGWKYPELRNANELWSLDFLHDALGGRKIRILPILDTFTKECHRIDVDQSIGGRRVTALLSEASLMHGQPENIVVDNGDYPGSCARSN